MIPKVLFLALFCAAHVQARTSILLRLNEPVENDSGVSNNPVAETRERSDRGKIIVNDWTNVDYQDYVNDNFYPSETGNGNFNFNGGRVVATLRNHPEVNKKVATHRVATNDEAHNIPDHEKIATAVSVMEQRTRKLGVAEFADTLGQKIDDVVEETVQNLDRTVESVLDVGRSVVGATGTIVAPKIKLDLSVPRIGERLFATLGKI